MQITWFGHSCFRIDTGTSSILIDPFLTGNATFENTGRYFQFETIVPCHYGTFPMLDQTAGKFVAEMGGNTVRVPKVGAPFEA